MRRAILLTLLSIGGCAYVAGYMVGSTAIYYGVMKVSKGTAYTDYKASQQATWDALIAELKAREIEYEVKEDGVQVSARGYTAETLRHPKERSYTRIQVKVGMFDQDERQAKVRAFLIAVGKRLGQEATVPAYPDAD